MKKSSKILFLAVFLISVAIPRSYALIVNDPINTAVNQLQNSILQTEWGQQIALAIEHLNQLTNQTVELFRFHSGLDEILRSIIGDPIRNLLGQGTTSLQNAFRDIGFTSPQIQMVQGANGPEDIRSALEDLTGKIPETDAKPYLAFDEMQVVDAFDLARQIREAGSATRTAATEIADQAATASPKGAVRLQAQAMSQLMVLDQQNQEAMAKLLELEATKIAQVSREEKRVETERLKFMEDAGDYAENISRAFTGA
ncbi:MAG TPA: hypothetical protein PKV84_01510 [Candidatus Omnitrophota bacterium]|nr:hypothetical protein [Candidatus Omnitrophota bacterium]